MEAGKSSEFVGGGNLSPRWVPGLSGSSVQLTFVTFRAAGIRPYGLVRTIQRTAAKTDRLRGDRLPPPTEWRVPFNELLSKWQRFGRLVSAPTGWGAGDLISLIRMHPGRGDCPPWGYFSIGVLNFQLFFTSLYKKYILQCVK